MLASPAACRRVLRELVDRAARGDLDDRRWSSVMTDLEHMRHSDDRYPRGSYSVRR